MSGVLIYSPAPFGTGGAAGGIPVGSVSRSFKDLFTRANSGNWGTSWMSILSSTSSAGSVQQSSIVSNTGSTAGPAAITASKLMTPAVLAWMSQVVRNQFSEVTLGTITGAFGFGPVVVMSPLVNDPSVAGTGFYFAQWNGTNIQIIRNVYTGASNSSGTQTSLSTIVATVTVGDVLRLEATNVAGTWTLTVKKNGTVIGSATDNTLVQGFPAIYYAQAGAGTIVISEYAGGQL